MLFKTSVYLFPHLKRKKILSQVYIIKLSFLTLDLADFFLCLILSEILVF